MRFDPVFFLHFSGRRDHRTGIKERKNSPRTTCRRQSSSVPKEQYSFYTGGMLLLAMLFTPFGL